MVAGVRVQVLLLMSVIVQLTFAGSGVTKQLQNLYAIEGSMAAFQCGGYASGPLFGIRINGTTSACSADGNLPKGVICQFSDNGLTKSQRVVTLNITVPAVIANNVTNVLCYFHDYNDKYSDTSATLFVTFNPPSAPGNPSVTFINLTMLNISWIAPWYPADSYILKIENMTAEGDTKSWTINSTNLIRTQEYSDGLCHSLEITVQAVSPLGNSFTSGVISGFPKELSPVNKNSIIVDQFQHGDKKFIRIDFEFKPPGVCSYQTLHYNFTLRDQFNNIRQTYGPTSTTHYEFNNVKLSHHYVLTIAVWDGVGVVYHTNKSIDSEFSITGDTSNPATANPTSPESAPASTTLLIGLIGGVGAAILMLVGFSVFLLLLFLLRTNKRQRQNVAATEESQDGPLQITRIPQVMSTNPTYDGFSNDAVYDCITNQKDLKQLQHSGHFSNNIPKTLMGEIPPQLPPPRKMSLESPGLKSNTQLSFPKTVSGVDLATPDNNCSAAFEEYVDMSSSVRYVKSPLASERKLMNKE